MSPSELSVAADGEVPDQDWGIPSIVSVILSVVSKYISNFLRVTGMSSQPINPANVLVSLGIQRD